MLHKIWFEGQILNPKKILKLKIKLTNESKDFLEKQKVLGSLLVILFSIIFLSSFLDKVTIKT